MAAKKTRCAWCGEDPLYIEYHDEEWGVPEHDETKLFEALCLEGAQAGLSWITILRKRENYRKAFSQFDAAKIARYSDAKLEKLLNNEGIIRNRLKVFGFRKNARAYLAMQKEGLTLNGYFWGFVDHQPLQNKVKSMKDIPANTPLAETISKDLKKRGFTFVGPTIVYAFMQAIGMVNDHAKDCFRYHEVQ
ncbi:MAG: DNA-3-methyladenine glycosylase I [Acidiferrobacterales bacterium]|nr:DNA-3-methyladenine glycosylase I [Acidiferrobacterales bacterium]